MDFEVILSVVAAYVALKALIRLGLVLRSIRKHFLLRELDLPARYGRGSWVLITGPSSGQGRQYALNFAKRGFNLILLGSIRTKNVMEEIRELVPSCQVHFLRKDFRRAFEDGFFHDVSQLLERDQLDVSVLVNCVAHRIGWIPYHEMPPELMRGSIAAGTIVQARLCHMLIPRMLKREKRSAVISVTAQCMHPNFGPFVWMSNQISIPYLSIYEPTNAWGHYHMNALIEEYGDQLDMLNITPGAVLTESTRATMKDTLGAVDASVLVSNVFKLLGQVQGETCAYWMHELSLQFINLAPMLKHVILKTAGRQLTEDFMTKYAKSPPTYE